MSIFKRFLGLTEPLLEPKVHVGEFLLEKALETKLAANDGITLINSGDTTHERVALVQPRVTNATRFQEPQKRSHTVTFGGSSTQQAIAFIEDLKRVMKSGEPKAGEFKTVLHQDLNDLAKVHYPGKIFQMSNDRSHELCDDKALDFKPRAYHEKAVWHAYKTGMTLEFCYRKPLPEGGRIFKIKRVLVTETHEDWFRGVDFRGPRNYSFNRVFSSGLEIEQRGVPLAEPYLQMLFLHGYFGQGIFMSFGLRGPDGRMINPRGLT